MWSLRWVVYLVEVKGVVPVGVEVRAGTSGLHLRFDVVSFDRVEPVGAVPKAVTLHGLGFTGGDRGWSCTVVVDV